MSLIENWKFITPQEYKSVNSHPTQQDEKKSHVITVKEVVWIIVVRSSLSNLISPNLTEEIQVEWTTAITSNILSYASKRKGIRINPTDFKGLSSYGCVSNDFVLLERGSNKGPFISWKNTLPHQQENNSKALLRLKYAMLRALKGTLWAQTFK